MISNRFFDSFRTFMEKFCWNNSLHTFQANCNIFSKQLFCSWWYYSNEIVIWKTSSVIGCSLVIRYQFLPQWIRLGKIGGMSDEENNIMDFGDNWHISIIFDHHSWHCRPRQILKVYTTSNLSMCWLKVISWYFKYTSCNNWDWSL